MFLGLEPPSEWCVATSHFLIYPVYNDFLSPSSLSTTLLQGGADPFLTPVEGSHIQKTQTASASKVCNQAGVGSQTSHFNTASWDRQTALSTGVKVRGWGMPYWAMPETQRAFFRRLVQSRFLPLCPACSLEKGDFTVCSLQHAWDHAQITVNIDESLSLLTWLCSAHFEGAPCSHFFPSHPDKLSFLCSPPSRALVVSPLAKHSNYDIYIVQYPSDF